MVIGNTGIRPYISASSFMTEKCGHERDVGDFSTYLKKDDKSDLITEASRIVQVEQTAATRRTSAVEEVSSEDLSKDRKVIGITSYPVSSLVSNLVVAYEAEESTAEDPIVQITMKQNGEKHTYNIHVNDVDPQNATDMEMFSYLTYQGHIGNKIPGAINNWVAYKTLQLENNWDAYQNMDYSMGEYNFMSKKSNALDIVESVHSWMKDNPHPDAQKQTKWCEQLIDMFKNKEVTYNTSSVARNSNQNLIDIINTMNGTQRVKVNFNGNTSDELPSFISRVWTAEELQQQLDDQVRNNQQKIRL